MKGITPDPATQKKEPPLMEDLYKALRGMEEPEASSLADRIEKFVMGSFAGIFDQRSNVDIKNRFTVFSIRDLEDALRPIAMFIIVGYGNAVNLTDGLDGLAGLIAATAFAGYGAIAHLQGQIFLVRFCFTIVGALFAFLWYNVHPAELFMGDTGSLALGATLGTVALMTSQWLLLPVVALIPLAETISVILQVFYFKYTRRRFGQGQRLFKMSPLHNHFELLGWSETQVVQRFWLVGLLAAMAGVALALW